MAVNEMPHAVVAIQQSVCCGCALTALNSQPAILKSLLIVASWAGCKLLEQTRVATKLRLPAAVHVSFQLLLCRIGSEQQQLEPSDAAF